MPNLIQSAGGAAEPTSFAPLFTNRIFTGLWTNRSLLRDAATTDYQVRSGLSRQDSMCGGLNAEISTKLTLRRRPGTGIYNANFFPPIKRFYDFHTFTLTQEAIRLMADASDGVYEATAGVANRIFTKSAGAGSTFFLGVGNTLYFTNGVDNKQWNPTTGVVSDWGLAAPPNAPVATQQPRANPYLGRNPNTGYATWVNISPAGALDKTYFNAIVIRGNDGNLQQWPTNPFASDPPATAVQYLGYNEPAWSGIGQTTIDGTAAWLNKGTGAWTPSYGYGLGDIVVGTRAGFADQLFVAVHGGQSNASAAPAWPQIVGQQVTDGSGGLVWQSLGTLKSWGDFGVYQNPQPVTAASVTMDSNGNKQTIFQMGKTTSSTTLTWSQETGALTTDNTAVWLNNGPYAQAATASVTYGYAGRNSANNDTTNMSPASNPIAVILGNQVVVTGDGLPAPIDTIILYRTAQGGSTYFQLTKIANPGPGQKWTFIDNIPDSGLSPVLQAPNAGENTPLPLGASCMAYHLNRIFVAVGNVIYWSTGPRNIVSGSNGNTGFSPVNTQSAQSRVTRLWACSLGLVVFTVRDAYIILGSGTDSDPLYMVTFIEQLPLQSYDAFTVNKTTPSMLLGNNMLISLDPSAGIIESGFPIADRFEEEYDPASAYVTFHSQKSSDTALYVADGQGNWYREAATNAPENGTNWAPKATIPNAGCVQSVEVAPGQRRLLIANRNGGPIMQRDTSLHTDVGAPFEAYIDVGNIVLALPGQLAALAFITLESIKTGTRPGLGLLLGEISGQFEELKRTRQDPPNLPPSETLYSDRYHFMQNQTPAWCRHFQMRISWPAEDAANELLTFTIFGQTWNEYRSQ